MLNTIAITKTNIQKNLVSETKASTAKRCCLFGFLFLVSIAGCVAANVVESDKGETDTATSASTDSDTVIGTEDTATSASTDSDTVIGTEDTATSPLGDTDSEVDTQTADTGGEEYYATCRQLLDANPGTTDGETTLYVDKDPSRPWTAYCLGMSDTPTEYLVLATTGNDTNFSQYTASGQGTDVRTVYTRLRFDPETLQVTTGDQTFSSSSGSLKHDDTDVTSMPFATAMSCASYGSDGLAVVDLAGTPFHVTHAFETVGAVAVGDAAFSDGDKRIDITVWGRCAWVAPAGSEYNPYNQRGGKLKLAYDVQ